MNTDTLIALAGLALAVNSVTVGSAVWVVRAVGKAKAAGPKAVREHEEKRCANFDLKEVTGVGIQAAGED